MKSAISRRISSPSSLHRHRHRHRHHLILQHRNFINTRLKWVRDPFLDEVVEREKNLLPCLSLKSLLLSSPSLSLPLSHPSLLHFHSPNPATTPTHLFHKYPSLFRIFRPHSPTSTSLPHHIKLTPQFLTLHHEEQHIHDSMSNKHLAAHRLLKFLMLTRASRLPLSLIDAFKFDLGLPTNYLLHLVSYFPDYFRVCQLNRDGPTHGNSESPSLGLELVSWNKDFAVPAILNEFQPGGDGGGAVEFPLSFAPGFDLQNKVKQWVDEWQSLPYISPYEDAFHLAPASDQADKWAVTVLHELLSLLVSKKTEVKNVLRLGDYLGFGLRFKKALAHHPGIFYVSNKIRTQTVLLRQAFRKHWLLDNHPLMGMRHRYIYLMSKSRKRNKFTKISTKHNLRIHGVAN